MDTEEDVYDSDSEDTLFGELETYLDKSEKEWLHDDLARKVSF